MTQTKEEKKAGRAEIASNDIVAMVEVVKKAEGWGK